MKIKNPFKAVGLDSGSWGERVAARYVRKQLRFKILGRNVRVGDHDEVDLICRDRDTLVFVEVKTRGSERHGRPMDSVDSRKRRALSRAAVRYVNKLKNPRVYIRFDVVEIIGKSDLAEIELHYITDAFQLEGGYDFYW